MAGISVLRSELNAKIPGLPLGDVLLGSIGEIRRGFIFEVIDTRSNQVLMTKSLVLNPKQYTLTEPFASTLTPTEDDTVVAEENGILIREITIEGTTGLMRRGEEALGRGGSITTRASGVDHFYQLRQMFREYGRLKQDAAQSPYIQMHFHNMKEDDHFVVVPRAFETPRDAASNRMHMVYRITLAAIQELPVLRASLLQTSNPLREISLALNDGRSFLVELIDTVGVYNQRIRNPDSFLVGAAQCLNSVNDLSNGASDTISLPLELFAAVADTIEAVQEVIENDIDRAPTEAEFDAARRVRNLRSSIERILNQPAKFAAPLTADAAKAFAGARNLTPNDLANNTAGATRGTRTRLALGSEADAGLGLGSFVGSRRVPTRAVDTIDTIANAAGVPREAIISLNNLRYPYIARGGGPGTIEPGDDILVPTRTGAQLSGASPSGGYLTADDIVYGVDLALDPAALQEGVFDILVDATHGATDAQLVRGQANVVQGVEILVGTELGATSYIPDLGIKRTPGLKGTLSNMLLASVYLREAILSDPRITGIDSSRVVLEGDKLTQEITVELLDTRGGVTLVVPFGKAAQ